SESAQPCRRYSCETEFEAPQARLLLVEVVRNIQRTTFAESVEIAKGITIRSNGKGVTLVNPNESDIGEEKVNPNVNCIEGKCCPECSSYGPFEVMVSMRVMLYDNGSGDAEDGTIEYNGDSPAMCPACLYEGKFADFGVDD